MLPSKIAMPVLWFDDLVLNLLDLVIFLFESDLRSAFYLLALEQLQAFYKVNFAFFKLSWLFYCNASCQVYSYNISV